ncbi:unnamed protein product [Adineta ricciae]|uniref:RZ-type domain-containing protein n=1 Tax=Adineta ricciae TaxID=249248 RepID=A0A814UX10_ADIRI|nr:unnamed protein product [Adineta ricciae]CAF1181878.1 unnamed protein product [Adineta ricciae]
MKSSRFQIDNDRKRRSTTSNDPLPSKRPYLPPISYTSLVNLMDKSPDDVLTVMLDKNFQLRKFLNDKRMTERFDWISSMTTLLEKTTQCVESREHLGSIFGQLPDTPYLEGVYEDIRKPDPNTYQLRFQFIELFLKIANQFLAMMPHSSGCLIKILERIELLMSKSSSDTSEFKNANEILSVVLERIKEIEKRRELLNPKSLTTVTTNENNFDQPPDDYRQLPIVPSINEIRLEKRPYLRKNIIDGIYESAKHYIDIHFRLLREDFIGPLRDGIHQYLYKTEGKNYNIRIYENVHSLGSQITPRSGLVYNLRLDPKVACRIHWANSRRLIYGNLLLLTRNRFQSCVFATVEDRSRIQTESVLSAKILCNSNYDQQTIEHLGRNDSLHPLTMIETMTFFEAYRPVLRALQIMPTDDTFPFSEFLIKLTPEMKPPNYLTQTTTYDFTPLLVDPNGKVQTHVSMPSKFDTRHMLKITYQQASDIDTKYKRVSVLNKNEWPTNEELHLNPKQYEALILALTNKIALIQGPPGTGKTYLGVRITEMLLHNRSVWCPSDEQSTPILMICHTNHALDQFLELIVNRLNITKGIIRVGSRCQNPIIQKLTLSKAREYARITRCIPSDIYYQKKKLMEKKFAAERHLKELERKMQTSQTTILTLSLLTEYFIIDNRHKTALIERRNDRDEEILLRWLHVHPGYEQTSKDLIYREEAKTRNDGYDLNEEEVEEERRRRYDEDEYEQYSPSPIQKCKKFKKNSADDHPYQYDRKKADENNRLIKSIIQTPTTLTDETVLAVHTDIWTFTMEQRYDLYRYWLSKYQKHVSYSIEETRPEYNQAITDLSEYFLLQDYYILKDSIIIAMTTTCAAKHHTILEKLQSKIVIVEEAAAIFEAHVITALSTKCEHLILIGDHVQLKPNPTVYQLGTKYNMDVSLFERLVKNNFPNVRLNIQHRMRPEIGRLMKHFYDDLEDDISVKTNRESIRGIDSDVFFINHQYSDASVTDGSSKYNKFEALYAIELAKYLIKQNYGPQQITILVMYLGQKQLIVKKMKEKRDLHGIRIMVTDNYQGEENDIIILSLVRSNIEKRIGFLKIHNRICVALSRARCGLFVLGNMDILAEVDEKWKQIMTSLVETNHIGSGLCLSCRQHPEDKTIADKIESFAQRPEGGCRKRCDARLKCGHCCESLCHNYDLEHAEVTCHQKCYERLSCGHLCQKQCHYENFNRHDQCRVTVDKKIPECGHEIRVHCSETPDVKGCQKTSPARLPCGHIINVPCHLLESPDELKRYPCLKPCNTILACEHKCVGTCSTCFTGRLHVPCGQKCERELICSHVCKESCAANCPLCTRDCQTRCVHSRCRKKCGELCIPCREPCAYKCKHLKCTRRCSELCNREPCNKPCYEKLRCGHQCIGLCGEPCPWKCRICDKSIVQEIFFGTEDEPDARFVFLPDCRHIIEVTSLDRHINEFVNESNANTAIRFPECPRCRQRIYRCTRYTSVLNRVYNLIAQVKKKILGHTSDEEISEQREQILAEHKIMIINLKEIVLAQTQIDFFSKLYDKKYFFSNDKLNLMANIIRFLNHMDTILIHGRIKLQEDIFKEFVHRPILYIVEYLYKQKCGRNFAQQQLNDIQWELKRIRRVIYIENFIGTLQKELDEHEQVAIDSMRKLTRKIGPFTNENKIQFDDLVKKFKYLNNLPGLGITEKERKAIVTALNMTKGHWYTCPKGHPYIITECGGAMQESQCPECGERIGGQNHHLIETNQHFGLMDGSQYGAWSNEANLQLPHLPDV